MDFKGEISGVPFLQLNHFDNPRVTIEDHRPGILDGLQVFFDSGSPETFLSRFNSTAEAEVLEEESGMQVVLHEYQGGEVDGFLWSAIGLTESIPAYDYQVWQIKPLGEERFALFSVFLMPAPRFSPAHPVSHAAYADK
jgi:hypothetical protein